MEIKIDKNGILWIKRGKKFKSQRCRHDGIFCGDSCPLFGEPQESGDSENGPLENGAIELCQKFLFSSVPIVDERV